MHCVAKSLTVLSSKSCHSRWTVVKYKLQSQSQLTNEHFDVQYSAVAVRVLLYEVCDLQHEDIVDRCFRSKVTLFRQVTDVSICNLSRFNYSLFVLQQK